MRRWALVAGALWIIGFLAVYLSVLHSQGDPTAWWYVAFLGLAELALCLAAAGVGGQPLVIGVAVMLVLAMLAGLLSVGLLLLPAVAAVGFAVASSAGDSGRQAGGASWSGS